MSSLSIPVDIPIPSKNRRPRTTGSIKGMTGGYCNSILAAASHRGNLNDNFRTEPNIMLAARQNRVRAESEMRLLQNRLQHLKIEEQKALQKAKKTEKRAKEIEVLKRKQHAHHQKLLLREKNKNTGDEFSQMQVKNSIIEHRHKMENSLKKLEEQKKKSANRIKQMKKEMAQSASMQRAEEYQKVRYRNFIIRSQREGLRQKKEDLLKSRIQKASTEYASKVAMEARRTAEMEDMLRKLELEEGRLIQRVKTAQDEQSKAYSTLHDAVDLHFEDSVDNNQETSQILSS